MRDTINKIAGCGIMKWAKCLGLFLLLGFGAHIAPARHLQPILSEQDSLFFALSQDSLIRLSGNLIISRNDSVRIKSAGQFQAYLIEILQKNDSWMFAFDSLRTVSFLTPPDSAFRIISWYVPLLSGHFRYYGLVQYPPESGRGILELTDQTPEPQFLTDEWPSNGYWLGAYYYDIIFHRYEDVNVYTLLGWKGYSPEIRMRVIETFSPGDSIPVFGSPGFRKEGKVLERIVFSYSARVSMSLLYETRLAFGQQEKAPMIVFDRLTPMRPEFSGQFRYYVPEGNIFDAFLFENGLWNFVSDVDARRPEDEPPQ